jgi:uncharacterized membrane protein
MHGVELARALHVVAVVIWIGGAAMATSVILPAIRQGDLGNDRLKAFHAIERRFIWQARAAVLVVGITGFYMVARLDLLAWFSSAKFWWMHAMVGVWALFMVVLFVVEPLVLHRYFRGWATAQPKLAFDWLQGAHWLLVSLSLITIFGAVAGSRGWSLF